MTDNKKPTAKQIAEWKAKAEKWDELDDIIGGYYAEPDGDDDESEGSLIEIGERAAMAFGYL